MEKVINGKLYNIDKSNLLVKVSIYDEKTNTDTQKEVLYKTSKDQYFLYSYADNIFKEGEKIGEDIKLMNIGNILDWYEKRQSDFDDNNKKKFFKEFGKFFMEG